MIFIRANLYFSLTTSVRATLGTTELGKPLTRHCGEWYTYVCQD
jgi:hypothetical protein